jgi:hypothetical protein
MKKTAHRPLKLSIETLRHLALRDVSGGAAEPKPEPLPSGCRAGCYTVLPTGTISKQP